MTTPANSIESVDVRNYMRVRKATLTVDGNTMIISGSNEQGKSSFVTAIEDIFGGGKMAPAMPIRKGATEAHVMVRVCADGRKLKAELTHTKSGRRLVVRDDDDKTQTSPQDIMNRFWADTSFDPSLFLISKPAEQTLMLMKLAGLDFAKINAERAEKFTLRTSVNRDVDRLKTVAAMKPQFPEAPKEEVSTQAVLDEIAIASKHNQRGVFLWNDVKAKQSKIDGMKSSFAILESDAKEIEVQIERLRIRLNEQRSRIDMAGDAIDIEKKSLEAALKEHTEFKEVDPAPLQVKLAGVEETNKQVRANVEKSKAVADARAKESEAEKLTIRIESIDEEKAEALRNAKFPIDGMSIDGDDVTIGGIPLAQQSDMRRLAIGVEMAAVMNPDKPLMIVRYGNLFTADNLHILQEIAQKRSLTCIVEVAGKNVTGSRLEFVDGVGEAPGAAPVPGDLPLGG